MLEVKFKQTFSLYLYNYPLPLISWYQETPIPGCFLVESGKCDFQLSHIINGPGPLIMSAHPCAELVLVVSGRELLSLYPETPVPGCFLVESGKCDFPLSHIINGPGPLIMSAHPCAELVLVVSGRELIKLQGNEYTLTIPPDYLFS